MILVLIWYLTGISATLLSSYLGAIRGHWKSLNPNLAISRLRGILRSVRLVNRGPVAAFTTLDQLDPWSTYQMEITLWSTILALLLWNCVWLVFHTCYKSEYTAKTFPVDSLSFIWSRAYIKAMLLRYIVKHALCILITTSKHCDPVTQITAKYVIMIMHKLHFKHLK